jgi:hypothetical protein
MPDNPFKRLCYALGFAIGLTIGISAFSFGANSPATLPGAPELTYTYTH